MWLILCEDDDVAAAWAHHGLRRRTPGPCELVTASDLSAARRLTHRVVPEGVTFEVELADGRAFRSSEITGTVNRLVWAGNPSLRRAQSADRTYAGHEWHSLCASWIYGLPGRVLNRPTGHGLCGALPLLSEWTVMAARAGLTTRPLRLGEDPGPGSDTAVVPVVVPVLVVDREVVTAGLDPSTAAACRRLASESALDLIGIELAAGTDGGWEFARASPLPDLRPGGEPLLDALAGALGSDRHR